MKTHEGNRIRSQVWEDDAPAEIPLQRAQRSVAIVDSDSDAMPPGRDAGQRDTRPRAVDDDYSGMAEPRTPWWRPSGGWGRAFLTATALLLLGALATGALLVHRYILRDNRFRIAGSDNIQATGLDEVRRAELLPVFGEDIGRNVFFVPLSERRRQLEQIPWIEQATVMRLLPDRIRVSVTERKPVAFVRLGAQVGLVDANGVLLTMPPALMAKHHYSFPVVSGIERSDPPDASRNRMALYQRLVAELDADGKHFSEQVSEIDLSDPEDARVLMPEPGGDVVAHFGEDHFLDRYQRYRAHIAEWRQQYPKLAAVDLRYEQQVVLKMSQESGGEQKTADATNGAAMPEDGATGHEAASKEPPKADAAKHASKPAKAAPAKPKSTTRKDKKKHAPAQRASRASTKSRKTHSGTPSGQGQ